MGIGEDPYIWLEDVGDPRVKEWAAARSAEAEARLRPLSDALYPRILEYVKRPVLILARVTEKGYFMLFRGAEYWVEYMDRHGARRRIVSSGDLGGEAIIHWLYTDRRGDRLAYFYSFAGLDQGVLRIVDPEEGEVLDELEGSLGEVVWLDDERYYYVRFYRSGRTPDGVKAPAERVFLRSLGGGEDMVFGEGLGTSYLVGLDTSLDGRTAMVTVSYGWMETSFYAGSLDDPSTWRETARSKMPLQPIECRGDRCLLLAYEDGGTGTILEVDRGSGDRRVLARSKEPIRWVVAVQEGMLASILVDAAENLRFYSHAGEVLWERFFDPPGSLSAPRSIGEEAVFIYSSFDTPYMLYSLRGARLRRLLGERLRSDIRVGHEWASSRDGTRIHMFVVRRKGVSGDKVLVYGYGGFGISLTPRFYPHILPFLDDGGVFVVANLRGGGEYGEEWHKAGMRRNKKKVFEDFRACIEAFKKRGARVVAMGSSNGGLLVGVAVTQYPELLDGAVIGYPVLDMLRFHKLYIGASWIPEYGDPEDPGDREYLASYSPYHNVRRGVEYPPILIHTGLNDDRVHPAHAFKFAAKLMEIGAPVMLRVETRAGHSGASPEVKAREYADIMAFVYGVLGLHPGGKIR